jgi:predicted Zn-ribbon and HTH transcriptional regulator
MTCGADAPMGKHQYRCGGCGLYWPKDKIGYSSVCPPDPRCPSCAPERFRQPEAEAHRA